MATRFGRSHTDTPAIQLSLRRGLRHIVRRAPLLVIAVTIATTALFAGIGGFNLRGLLASEYSDGFSANLKFVPDLLGAYLDYRSRQPSLANGVPRSVQGRGLEELRIGVYQPRRGEAVPIYDALNDLNLQVRLVEPATSPAAIRDTVDVLIFPQGGYTLRNLPAGEADRIRESVRNGVHYVGVCAGSIMAVRELGLAPALTHQELTMTGLLQVRTDHPLFWGDLHDRTYTAHFANGGYFSGQSESFEPIVEVRNMGAVAVAGRYGAGDVVLFTFHPGGGGLTMNNQSLYFSGRDLRTGELFLHTLANLSARSVRTDVQ